MELEPDSSNLTSESPGNTSTSVSSSSGSGSNSPTVSGIPATIRSMSSSLQMERSYQDLEGWLSKLSQGMPLAEQEVKMLCDLARETFLQESNVQPVSAPVTVCGDIHGTYEQVVPCCVLYVYVLTKTTLLFHQQTHITHTHIHRSIP